MTTVSIEEARFVPRLINGEHEVMMPEFLAQHPSFDDWERVRFASMKEHLNRGNVLFDVGAEVGSISAVYAKFVGPENMVMFEGNPDNWQNIKATWDVMKLATPLCTAQVLVSNVVNIPNIDKQDIFPNGWPDCAKTGRIWTPRSYRYIHEHAHNTTQTTIDSFVAVLEIIPDAITIDIEGAELLALQGAINVLKSIKPLVWVSIHEDLMMKNYGHHPMDVLALMDFCGYTRQHLGTDHEAHYFFRPE